MKATDFEYRHQTLVHQLIVAVAFLTYLIQPDDIVWQFVKNRVEPQTLERILFIVATLFIGAGAALCTWARAHSGEVRNSAPRLLVGHWWYSGEFIYAIGLGSLAPPWGFVILVLGEALRLTRLIGRESGDVGNLRPGATTIPRWVVVAQRNGSGTTWGMAFRREIVKWAILISSDSNNIEFSAQVSLSVEPDAEDVT